MFTGFELNSTLKSLVFWMVLIAVAVLVWNFSSRFQRNESATTFSSTVERLNEYSGSPLKGRTFQCRSDQLAAGGFWRGALDAPPKQGVMSGPESQVTTWRINVEGETAAVMRFTGSTQTLEAPQKFAVEETKAGGMILVSKSRLVGDSLEAITIDRSNASFVYSSQHVNAMWNRVNVFYGRCEDE
jgi:hypothetical protein